MAKGLGLLFGVTLVGYAAYRYFKAEKKEKVKKPVEKEELLEMNLEEDIKKIGSVYKNDQDLIPFD